MRKNYFYNLLMTVFNLVIPIVSFPFVARALGPEGVGKAQFILSIGLYVSMLAALGIPSYGVREIARVRHDKAALGRTFRELLLVNAASCAVATAGLTALLLFHPFFRADALLYIAAIALVLCSFTSVEWLFSGLESFRPMALRAIVIKSASLIALLCLVRTRNDVHYYLWISIAAILANNAGNIIAAKRIFKAGAGMPLHVRRHLKPLFLLFATTIAATLYTSFDSVLLGLLSNERAVGLYAAATRVSKIFIPVMMAYGGVLLPQISRSISGDDRQALSRSLNRSYAYILLLAVPVSSGLFIFAPGIVSLFSGRNFSEAIPTMRFMAALPLLIGLGYFWGYQVTLPLGRDRVLLIATLFGMAVSLSLNFLLVPHWQQNGAAVACLAAEAIVTAAYYRLIRRHLNVKLRLAYFWEAIIACLPMWGFILLQPDFIRGNVTLTFLLCGTGGTMVYLLIQAFLFRNTLITEVLSRSRFFKPS